MGRMRDGRPVCLHSGSDPAEDKAGGRERCVSVRVCSHTCEALLC